jgi:hypothetical protein
MTSLKDLESYRKVMIYIKSVYKDHSIVCWKDLVGSATPMTMDGLVSE